MKIPTQLYGPGFFCIYHNLLESFWTKKPASNFSQVPKLLRSIITLSACFEWGKINDTMLRIWGGVIVSSNL